MTDKEKLNALLDIVAWVTLSLMDIGISDGYISHDEIINILKGINVRMSKIS